MVSDIGIDEAFQLYLPEAPAQALTGKPYFNNDDLRKAGAQLLEWVALSPIRATLTAFGYPGNGKRAFVRRLSADALERRLRVLWLDVQSLMLQSPDDVEESLASVRRLISKDSLRPLVFVVDDLDSVEPSLSDNPSVVGVRALLKECSSPESSPHLLILGLANSPAQAIRELGPAYSNLVYFDWPDETKIAELLEAVGIPESTRIAHDLFGYSEKNGIRYTAGSVINAAKDTLQLAGARDFKDLDAADLAAALRHLCSPTLKAQAEAYEAEFRDYVEAARISFSQWLKEDPA